MDVQLLMTLEILYMNYLFFCSSQLEMNDKRTDWDFSMMLNILYAELNIACGQKIAPHTLTLSEVNNITIHLYEVTERF